MVFSRNRQQEAQDDISDDDEEAEHRSKSKRTLRSCVKKAMLVASLIDIGVKRKNIKRNQADLMEKRSTEHEVFLSEVLGSFPLMKACADRLRAVNDHIVAFQEEGDLDKESFMDIMTRTIHEVKVCTATACWLEHISSMRENLSMTVHRYDEMRAKFNEVRSAYLAEVGMLRDQQRHRDAMTVDGEEEHLQEKLDHEVKYFFEPTQAVLSHEQGIIYKLVTEKVKMIFEKTPGRVEQVDVKQLQNLAAGAQNAEIEKLEKALAAQRKLVAQLQKQVESGGNPRAVETASPTFGGGGGGDSDRMVSYLEDQVSLLRGDLLKAKEQTSQSISEQESMANTILQLEENIRKKSQESHEQQEYLRTNMEELESHQREVSNLRIELVELRTRLRQCSINEAKKQQQLEAPPPPLTTTSTASTQTDPTISSASSTDVCEDIKPCKPILRASRSLNADGTPIRPYYDQQGSTSSETAYSSEGQSRDYCGGLPSLNPISIEEAEPLSPLLGVGDASPKRRFSTPRHIRHFDSVQSSRTMPECHVMSCSTSAEKVVTQGAPGSARGFKSDPLSKPAPPPPVSTEGLYVGTNSIAPGPSHSAAPTSAMHGTTTTPSSTSMPMARSPSSGPTGLHRRRPQLLPISSAKKKSCEVMPEPADIITFAVQKAPTTAPETKLSAARCATTG